MNNEIKIKCSGHNLTKPAFKGEGRKMFYELIDIVRGDFDYNISFFKNPLVMNKQDEFLQKYFPNQFCKEGRFDDNDDVLLRIQSSVTEEAFCKNPTPWMMAGLVDAGNAEHHYQYEKDWGEDEK